MRAHLVRVVKQTVKRTLLLTAATVTALSSLAFATPMLFVGNAAAAGQSTTLLINEVFPSPNLSSQNEWVEIYNQGPTGTSLADWDITTQAYDFSGNANVTNNCNGVVPAHGYCVFTNSATASSQQLLRNSGDTVTLSNGSYSDSVTYGSISSSDNQSWARTTNGGSWGGKTAPTMASSNDPTEELSVCASNCDTTSFSTAVSGISNHGTIYIGPGTYEESATLTASFVTIIGSGQTGTDATIIKAPLSIVSEGTILTVSGNNANISNLTVEGPGPSGCGSLYNGIYVKNAAGVNLHDLTVTGIADNTDSGCQNGIGIQVGRAADSSTGSATMDRVTVSSYQKNGIVVDNNGSSATITNSIITGRGAVNYIAQNGVQFSRGATGSLSTSTISGNECDDTSDGCGSDPMNDVQSVGVLLYQAGSVTISKNTISSNDIGIYSLDNGIAALSSNTLSNNRYEGLMFDQGSTSASDNTISGGNIGILAASYSGNTDDTRVNIGSGNTVSGATTEYSAVDQSSTDSVTTVINQPSGVYVGYPAGSHIDGYDAFSTIQGGIDAAADGGTVHVAAGTYHENVVVNKVITLEGANAATTKIVATDANHSPLTFATDGATVSGFTIAHDYTNAEKTAWNFNNNGVTFSQLADGNTLKDSTVTLNRNGIYLNNSENNVITGNTITNNRTGINMLNDLSGTKITGNVISDNWTEGLVTYGYSGSIPVNYSTITVTGNTFDNNWYEEVTVKDAYSNSGTLDVSDNTFTDSPVTYTTSSDATLNEPGFAAQQPVALGGTATEPSSALPTLRIYDSSPVTLAYSHPKTLNVTSGQYTTIQSAIDDAASGDTISIANGTYDGAINITKPLSLVGQSQGGVVVNQTAATPFGYGVSIVGINGVSISDMTFNTVSGAPVNYALQAYQASNVNLTNLAFNGPGKTGLNSRGSKIGGVDINSSSNLSYDNVQVSSFSKNGFSVTAKYSTSDTASSNLSFSNISATGNNWAGLAFYNTNSSGSVASNITGVSFSGNNVFSGNGQGIFVEGDTDANFGAGNAARYGISAAGDGNVAIHNSTFSGNGQAIVNYQTNGLDASLNYWGSASPDFSSLISGSVNHTPWYTNSSLTSFTSGGSSNVTTTNTGTGTTSLPSGTTGVMLTSSTKLDLSGSLSGSAGGNITVDGSTQPLSNYSSGNISGQNLNSINVSGTTVSVGQAVELQSGSAGQPITITNSDLNNVTVSVPDSTTILAPSGWDGTITPPTTGSSSGTAPSGFAVGSTVIEVGAPSAVLLFDKPVMVELDGVTGQVGYRVAGSTSWVLIPACSNSDYNTAQDPGFPGACSVSDGTNTKIWTYHFTSFASMKTVAPSNSGGSSKSSSGSSGSSSASGSTSQSGTSGAVQGVSTSANSGKTSSLTTTIPSNASLSQTKAVAKAAAGGNSGLAWYWYVLIAVAALALAAGIAYRYAEGTDEA